MRSWILWACALFLLGAVVFDPALGSAERTRSREPAERTRSNNSGPAARARSSENRARRAAERAEQERIRLAKRSRSVGAPWQGRLERGVELRVSPTIRRTTEYAAAGNFFGTFELVQMLERAAAGVSRRYPGSKLSVGELSRQSGGEIDGHGSHENGRDVDLSFYILDGAGRPFEPFAFAQFDGNGQARAPNQGLRFDDERNWDLVSRLVTDADARVQYIFVARPIRERLLAYGRRRHASERILNRAEAVLVQPAEGHPHRNHFHVRIYCDPSDKPQCKDREPFHSWYPGTPPTASASATGPRG